MTVAPPSDSTGLAAGLSVVVLLVLLAIAATIILVVSNSGVDRTATVTQPTATTPFGGQPATP